jgi:hypothetical protein
MAAESISNQRGKKGKQQAKSETARKSAQMMRDVRGALGETAEQVSEYVSEGVEQVRHRVRETTRNREGTAVVVALAAGFGIGIALGISLAPQRRTLSWHERMRADGLGRRVREGLESVVPQRLTECFRK